MKEEKKFTEWTIEEFRQLPRPNSYTNFEIGEVDSLVILPCDENHDSGFRCMEFVTIQNGKPTFRVSGCSDVIHLGGIGGWNNNHNRIGSNHVPIVAWSIDCLPVSGLLRIFCDKKIIVGACLSSFELFFKEN